MANKATINLNVKRPNGTTVFTNIVKEADTLSAALTAALADAQAQADASSATAAEKVDAVANILGA